MVSSPMNVCTSSPCPDSEDMYCSSPEPRFCDCQNQLGHFDLNGILREDLPDSCKRTMGIKTEVSDDISTFGSDKINSDVSVAEVSDDIFTFGSDNIDSDVPVAEVYDEIGSDDIKFNISATEPDPEWEQVVLRRATRDLPKDLVRNAEENVEVTLTDTKREVSIVKDKRDARDLSSTKGRKRRLSDKENTDTWRRKKNKKGIDFHIKFHAGKKRSTVKISIKIT